MCIKRSKGPKSCSKDRVQVLLACDLKGLGQASREYQC